MKIETAHFSSSEVVSAHKSGNLRFWDLSSQNRAPHKVVSVSSDPITSLVVSPRYVACATMDEIFLIDP